METLVKVFWTIVSLFGALVPVWIFFLARAFLEPIGFWQNAALIVGWQFLCGWLQIWLGILFIALIVAIWDD